MNIDTLIEQAKENEAKVIYEMIKASNNNEGVFNYPSTLKGIEANAVVDGNSLILTYVDGTVSTYTEE
jgi:hypothetical protein